MPNPLRPFLIALQFLTRLPVRLNKAPEALETGRSLLYFPAVGLLIGAILASLTAVLPEEAGFLPAAILLIAWVAVTGALHLDGLADSADAWAGGAGDSARTLAIMKDPRCGPMGAVAVVLVLLFKFAALDLALARHDLLAIALAPLLGRSSALLLFLTSPYVRPGGLGEALARELPRRGAIGLLCFVAMAVSAAAWGGGIGMVPAALVMFAFLRWLMMQRLGGTTGDTAGALIELTECAALAGALL